MSYSDFLSQYYRLQEALDQDPRQQPELKDIDVDKTGRCLACWFHDCRCRSGLKGKTRAKADDK